MTQYKSILKCPVCNLYLSKDNKQYVCLNNHSFDISSKGYVNLLLANQKKTKDPGDGKEMMLGRKNFLDKGYYEEFSERLNTVILSNITDKTSNILDAGCGEGYFLSRLKSKLQGIGLQGNFYGVDISKSAVTYGAKRDKEINFIVGSNFNIPIMSNSMDIIIRNFAPGDEGEFHRVLKRNGKLIVITPGIDHLFGLKEILYVNPRKHEEKDLIFQGFNLINENNVKYDIHLNESKDVQNLISMTPYSWNFDFSMKEKASETNELNTNLDFNISVYEKY